MIIDLKRSIDLRCYHSSLDDLIFSGDAKDEGDVLFGDLQNLMSFLACYTPIDYSSGVKKDGTFPL